MTLYELIDQELAAQGLSRHKLGYSLGFDLREWGRPRRRPEYKGSRHTTHLDAVICVLGALGMEMVIRKRGEPEYEYVCHLTDRPAK